MHAHKASSGHMCTKDTVSRGTIPQFSEKTAYTKLYSKAQKAYPNWLWMRDCQLSPITKWEMQRQIKRRQAPENELFQQALKHAWDMPHLLHEENSMCTKGFVISLQKVHLGGAMSKACNEL